MTRSEEPTWATWQSGNGGSREGGPQGAGKGRGARWEHPLSSGLVPPSQIGSLLLLPGEPTCLSPGLPAVPRCFSVPTFKASLTSLLGRPSLMIPALSTELIITLVSTCVRCCAQWMCPEQCSLPGTQWERCSYVTHVTDEETGSERFSKLTRVTQHPSL